MDVKTYPFWPFPPTWGLPENLRTSGGGLSIWGKYVGKRKLNKQLASEVENIMNLALDWLGTWDVTGEGVNKDPIKTRIKAMHKMKDAVSALALKAQITSKII